jgi:hypothetical protein
MTDWKQVRQNAVYVQSTATDSWTEGVARALIEIIDDPSLVVPAGYRLVKMPELLEKGVPRR